VIASERKAIEEGGHAHEDPDASDEARFVTLGTDALGRILIAIHTPREERTRIISARRASPGEVKIYHA
jgi:uncharacterized protein